MCRINAVPSTVVVQPTPDLLAGQEAKSFPLAAAALPNNQSVTFGKPKRAVYSSIRSKKPTSSILRRSSYEVRPAMPPSNSFMSIPELVSIHDALNFTTLSRESSAESIASDSSCCEEKKVSFHNKVAVQEFRRLPGERQNTWYTPEDMQTFMEEAAHLVRQYNRTHWLGWFRRHRNNVLHSHPALAATDEDDDEPTVQNQIQRILIVDSHDLSLHLFAKAFQEAFPQAVISTATGSKDALCLLQKATVAFDLVVMQERLSLFSHNSDSGSELLKVLGKRMRNSLFIGVSAHIEHDQDALAEAGADLCWSKPPPLMDESMAEKIFQTLITKRNL